MCMCVAFYQAMLEWVSRAIKGLLQFVGCYNVAHQGGRKEKY